MFELQPLLPLPGVMRGHQAIGLGFKFLVRHGVQLGVGVVGLDRGQPWLFVWQHGFRGLHAKPDRLARVAVDRYQKRVRIAVERVGAQRRGKPLVRRGGRDPQGNGALVRGAGLSATGLRKSFRA
jgi:hypothetical protein